MLRAGRLSRVALDVLTIAACLLFSVSSAAQTSPDAWKELEARGAVIATVEIVVRDVFDLSRPAESHWIGRTANAVHQDTRQGVIARELLFAAGDRVNASRIEATARNLRQQPFVRDARIIPIPIDGASVSARVEVDDAWSLLGSVNVSRTGGNAEWSVRLEEVNLLGHGKRLFFEHERTLERHANQIGYIDPQLLGSRWTASVAYSNLSDGAFRFVSVERPYFSVEVPYALGGSVSTSEFVLTQYNHGTAVRGIPVRRSTATLFGSHAYHVRNRTAFRVGASLRASESLYGEAITVDRASLPAADTSTRRTRGVSVTWRMVQERPQVLENMRSIGRTEDFNLGWVLSGAAGLVAAGVERVSSAPSAEIAFQKAWSGRASLLLVDAALAGRRERGEWRDALGRATVTVYNRSLRAQTIAANLGAVSSTRPDSADWIYLGGRDGLRGYVDHFLAGDRRVTMTIEDRIITSWRPLGLLQAGFVAYLDAGIIRRADTARWSRTYANAGAGLRFGLPKSPRDELLQLSIAAPLVREPGMDGLVIVLGNTVTF